MLTPWTRDSGHGHDREQYHHPPPQNPSWPIPVNPWPAPKMQPAFGYFLSCSLASIYNWPKGTQNLCHMTGFLASSGLFQLTSSPNAAPTHSSLEFAAWFLRRAARMRWQAHAHMHSKPLGGWALPLAEEASAPAVRSVTTRWQQSPILFLRDRFSRLFTKFTFC